MLEKLKKIIWEANPEKFDKKGFRTADNRARIIRLAGVLLAVKRNLKFETEKMEELIWDYWKLDDDNLDNQSKPTIEFLYKILK